MVYSQPIVDIGTRETVDEELLVRLRLVDTDEILQPSQFLPQCEQHKLMPVIDRYMIGRAIELARTGRRVSVNITGQTITNTAVMGQIIELLTVAGPQVTANITFEITETTALASPAIAKAFSKHMRDLGSRVALDDFGTGYGTLTELRHLHLHELKIDQSFVHDVLGDPDDERVVATVVSIAQAYGLSTVAEGVESEAILKKIGGVGGTPSAWVPVRQTQAHPVVIQSGGRAMAPWHNGHRERACRLRAHDADYLSSRIETTVTTT
ncbi:MAG TPA: EAL domain-containing protein [Gordonia sp. (in: high G+C Gram-positive bacteria)]|uniref:EAL domain-containing protein n=1 Tax=Gordonia sp. (in: high G+C Gram-positive bacteria) TaxID=84139 RepID=UPI002B78A02B|nr:EAL domain-containing protein [Gordonia sp. (in: high G+C Gram-positive bacteria)]HNP58671.1 EAL domain-containing protein [Gordonia sp. (in: high G+C Gram-positive bacteria)]HRC52346.1 EAL domain-containing protein [Gordonia sp. (in: high G+C Gram-positive bacteria)]